MLSEGFFNKGETRDDLKCDGNVPADRERLTAERIVGAIAGEMSFSRDVGIGSRSQNELEHCEMRVVISSKVAGLKRDVIRII